MKKNLTFISFLWIMALALFPIDNTNAQCYNYLPGTFADGLGGPFTDLNPILCGSDCGTAVPTGFEIYAGEGYTIDGLIAGSEYVIDLSANCDPSTIITVGAADADGTTALPLTPEVFTTGCSLTWTVPADGDYIIVIQTAANCGSAPIVADNGTLVMDCGPAGANCPAANDCTVATAGVAAGDAACVDFGSNITLTNTGAIIPNLNAESAFRWFVSSAPLTTPTDPFNDPAYLGAFGAVAVPNDIAFANDDAGVASGATYYFTCMVYGNATIDATTGDVTTDPACTFVSNSVMVDFRANGNPCVTATCTAPTATASYDCATDMVVVDVTDPGVVSTGGTAFYITVGDATQVLSGAGMYSFMASTDQTWTAIITDSTETVCDVFIGVLADCETLCTGASEGVVDGGFDGAPGSAWAEVSTLADGTATNVGLVDPQLPFDGLQSAWLGGWGADGSISNLSQSITIPSGISSATLSFWGLIGGECSADDIFEVNIDGTVLFTQDGTTPNCSSGEWHLYTIDLGAYADGLSRTLNINYIQVASSNFFVDAVSLVICPCPTLSLSTSSTGETCSDASGTATVNVTGGTGATYMWSNGDTDQVATGLVAGDYMVTVTDIESGCTAMATATVLNSVSTTALMVTTTSMDENCGSADGSATVDMVTGGSGNNTYAWVNGETTQTISGLTAGTYPVTVTDMMSGCSGVAVVTVGSAGGPNAAIDNITDATCFFGDDGSITVSASGGDGDYNYAWSNGGNTNNISGLVAGSYTCTVTDGAAACPFVINASVGEPMEIDVMADNVMNVSCNGGSNGAIMITVTGGTEDYTYAWSNGATTQDISGLSAGDYTGTITDANGCELVAGPITITEPDAIMVAVDDLVGSTGADGIIAITVTGGTAPYSFVWSNGALTEDLSALAPGDYSGTITDANGCTLVAGPVTVDNFVGVEDLTEVASFSMNPNPTSGNIRIEMALDAQYDVQLELFDVTGRTILSDYRNNTINAVFNLDLGNYTNGVYFARFVVDGKTFTERIVKSN